MCVKAYYVKFKSTFSPTLCPSFQYTQLLTRCVHVLTVTPFKMQSISFENFDTNISETNTHMQFQPFHPSIADRENLV